MSRGFWRAVQGALGLAIITFVVLEFRRNWDEVRATTLAWEVRPLLLVASAVLTWVMYAGLIAAWRALLADWGQPLAPWQAGRIWAVSSLGKYLPGKVWAIAGMALMARQAGVAAWAATASAVILQALAVGTGVVVVGLGGTAAMETAWPGARIGLAALAVASAGGVALLVSPRAAGPLLRRVVPGADPTWPRARTLAFGIGANLAAWVGYGAAFWLLARGLLPGVPLTFPAAVGAFTASYLAGLLALVVPGGLGVREGVFVLLLQGPLGLAPAAALAVASRILLTVTEVGVAVPFLVYPGDARRVPA